MLVDEFEVVVLELVVSRFVVMLFVVGSCVI